MKDYFGYNGKACLVTGASSGMGRATAEILVDLGADVYAVDINECPVEGIKKFYKVNLANKEEIDALFADLPEKIDKYFGIAGVSGALCDTVTTIKINFISNKYICENYLLDRLADGPVGAIAFVSSIAGAGWPGSIEESRDVCEAATCEEAIEIAAERTKDLDDDGTIVYNWTKRTLNYYAMYLLEVFGDKNVRINVVGPGVTKTALFQQFVDRGGGEENSQDFMGGTLDGFAEAVDQAKALVFFNSDLAPFVNGQILYVDGGYRGRVDAEIIDFDLMAGDYF